MLHNPDRCMVVEYLQSLHSLQARREVTLISLAYLVEQPSFLRLHFWQTLSWLNSKLKPLGLETASSAIESFKDPSNSLVYDSESR